MYCTYYFYNITALFAEVLDYFFLFQIRPSNWVTICNFKWAFFLLHQSWFLLAPCAFVALEWEKGNKPAGSDLAASAINMARQMTVSKA